MNGCRLKVAILLVVFYATVVEATEQRLFSECLKHSSLHRAKNALVSVE